ncbi:hypothetical protein [Mucilaginibacter ginkgonis]|nr:hypothetical protein [Mucilaginibacter ginkgonis]
MEFKGFVKVKGAWEHNIKIISLEIPRDALVVFTGTSGSGKSSFAFGMYMLKPKEDTSSPFPLMPQSRTGLYLAKYLQ